MDAGVSVRHVRDPASMYIWCSDNCLLSSSDHCDFTWQGINGLISRCKLGMNPAFIWTIDAVKNLQLYLKQLRENFGDVCDVVRGNVMEMVSLYSPYTDPEVRNAPNLLRFIVQYA